jgi:uncharacterized protein
MSADKVKSRDVGYQAIGLDSGLTKDEILAFLERKKSEFYNDFQIKEIGLFGSYSRGDQAESSDIDIVYILEEDNRFGYFQLVKLEEMLSERFQRKIELVNYKYMNPIVKLKAEKEIIYV